MDKNTWIGFLLIAAIFVGFTMLNRPSKEELAKRQHEQDSIAALRLAEAEAQRLSDSITAMLQASPEATAAAEQVTEEDRQARLQAAYGNFAPAAQGEEQFVQLENEHVRLTLSTHGGMITQAELLGYHAAGDSLHPLCLFRGDESQMAFTLITANNRILQTSNLYFTPVETEVPGRAILRLPTSTPDAWLDLVYDLSDNYMVHLTLQVTPNCSTCSPEATSRS